MVVHHDIRTEPIHKNNAISRCRGRDSSRVENFGRLDLMKPVAFEVQEHRLLQILQAGFSNDGDRANLS